MQQAYSRSTSALRVYERASVIDQSAIRNFGRTHALTVATGETEIEVRFQSRAYGEVTVRQRPHQGDTPARRLILCTRLAVGWAVRETQTTGDAAFGVVPDFRREVQVVYGRSETGNGIVSTKQSVCDAGDSRQREAMTLSCNS
jgi:hypothetical protein